jgi:hypothetical protein
MLGAVHRGRYGATSGSNRKGMHKRSGNGCGARVG